LIEILEDFEIYTSFYKRVIKSNKGYHPQLIYLLNKLLMNTLATFFIEKTRFFELPQDLMINIVARKNV
jgi:CMP-N-acetylneuraminic acid synthetase